MIVGAYEGLGYGESVGALIERRGPATSPPRTELRAPRRAARRDGPSRPRPRPTCWPSLRAPRARRRARWPCRIPGSAASLQAAAFRLGVPFTGHPMIGHDIIYNHPVTSGAAIGRAAERDFLAFADGVSRLEGGVYLSRRARPSCRR